MILTLFLVFFAFLIMGMGAFGSYTYYKRKKAPTWTLSSSNPEYIDTVGPRFSSSVWFIFQFVLV